MVEVSYAGARERLTELWDRAVKDREAIRLTWRGSAPVVLLATSEYEGLLETVHLQRSPTNASRRLGALACATAGQGDS